MISVIRQFKTHGITTYVKEIVLQHSLCLYEHQSYSKWDKPRIYGSLIIQFDVQTHLDLTLGQPDASMQSTASGSIVELLYPHSDLTPTGLT